MLLIYEFATVTAHKIIPTHRYNVAREEKLEYKFTPKLRALSVGLIKLPNISTGQKQPTFLDVVCYQAR